ncbi:hypothetical protein 000TH008_83 [Bacillus phage 000TH008]|nr:hypothetical protein 000TH008_83 [Bacillus phage 000TH008]QQO40777.1 hypothetical protein 000TH009_83 [Bacillus phage 000TH009]
MSHDLSSLSKFIEEYSLFNVGLNPNFIGTVSGRFSSGEPNKSSESKSFRDLSIELHSSEYMEITAEIIELVEKANSLAKYREKVQRGVVTKYGY